MTCDEAVISRLSNKASLSDYAKRLGMLTHLPAHYANPAEARYPCLLKAAEGEHPAVIFKLISDYQVDINGSARDFDFAVSSG